MKLATFRRVDTTDDRVGVVRDDGVMVDLSGYFASMLELIEAGEGGLRLAGKALKDGEIQHARYQLRAPIPVPVQLRDCIGFERHVEAATKRVVERKLAGRGLGWFAPVVNRLGLVGVPQVWYRQPLYYKCNRMAVSGPDDVVVRPAYSELMDFELEIACVIGTGGRDIAKTDVERHIFGFTIYNDFSARDAQIEEMDGRLGPAKGKDFDGSNALGPWIVTPDELGDAQSLQMRASVNGECWSVGSTAQMHHGFADIIAHISRGETLYPGEVIGSGTVGGGCGLELDRFLVPGDRVELRVEGIGALSNYIG